MEQQLRKQAVERLFLGESPKSIHLKDVGRSKNWFFKWLKRYQTGNPDWYKDRSRVAINRPTELNKTDKQRTISTRIHLQSQKFAQVSASAIKWELTKSG